MRFGLFGGASAGRDSVDSSGYAGYVDYVCAAEELGFAGSFVVEHHFTGIGQLSASLTLLAYIAARTRRIRLGTAVVVLPWHNPVLLAEQVAALDLLSGGRFDFGVGKGYRAYEFAGFCVSEDEATARFDESIAVMKRAWTKSRRFSHHGRFWRFADILVEPPPLQRPHPPLWLGAGSEPSIRRAAREGYNLLLDQLGSIALTGERIALFRDECERVGRAYDPMMVGVTRALHLVDSEEQRLAALRGRRRTYAAIGDLARGKGAERFRSPDSFTDAELEVDDAPLVGSPPQLVEQLRRLNAAGAGYVLLAQSGQSVAGLARFAREVMPAFAESPALTHSL